MNINDQNDDKISLEIMYEQMTTKIECNLSDVLEIHLIKFAKLNNLNYSSIYFLYSGNSLIPSELKRPISEIITSQDKNEKRMLLLSYKLEIDVKEDEVIIVLSIESVKIKKSSGGRGEKIKDIIKNIIELDLKWCTFKYRNNEIDIEQKFDDIANEEDKRQLKIDLTVNYTIPLIVNFSKGKKSKYSIQCLLRDRVNDKIYQYFREKKLESIDYDLFYENKIFENYYHKTFYEIIPEDKIQNNTDNSQINETIQTFPTCENINELNKIVFNNEKKINVLPINEINKGKIEIEIKVKLKKCNVRYRRKLKNCCDKIRNCFKTIFTCFAYVIIIAFGLAFVFLALGFWVIFFFL